MKRSKSKWWTIRVLFTPSCWLQNERYNKRWDEEIVSFLANGGVFTEINGYEAKLGNRVVWIENHPYASFTVLIPWRVRPSRSTILWAWHCLNEDLPNTDNDEIAELEKLMALGVRAVEPKEKP